MHYIVCFSAEHRRTESSSGNENRFFFLNVAVIEFEMR